MLFLNILLEWRMRSGPFDSIHGVLRKVAHSYGFEVRLWEFRLRMKWPSIVGESIAAHTQPQRLRFRKLYVIVENSVWMHQLTFLKPALLEKIQARAGTDIVTDLIFRLGIVTAAAAPPAPEKPPAAIIAPTRAFQEAAQHHADSVTNPELREALANLIAHALSTPPHPKQRIMAAKGTPSRGQESR